MSDRVLGTSDIERMRGMRARGIKLPSFLDGLVDQRDRALEEQATWRPVPPPSVRGAERAARVMRAIEANKQ